VQPDPRSAAQRHSVVVSGYDFDDPDVRVTADVDELWSRYGDELRSDGMEGKTPEEIIKHVYQQNSDLAELEVEDV
jgi:hypothetical protein